MDFQNMIIQLALLPCSLCQTNYYGMIVQPIVNQMKHVIIKEL